MRKVFALLIVSVTASVTLAQTVTSKIVFQRVLGPFDDDIFMANEDGSGLQNLTNYPGLDGSPSICSDGLHIAFWSNREPGSSGNPNNRDVFIMKTDGTEPVDLTPATSSSDEDNPNCGWPALSPQVVVFDSDRDGNREIYRVNTDQTNPVRLTVNPASESSQRPCSRLVWEPNRL